MPDMSPEVNEIATALAKAQASFPVVKTDSTAEIRSVKGNRDYHYASLAAVIDAVRGPLAANGICYTQILYVAEGCEYLETMLIHTSGQWLCSSFRIPRIEGMNAQAVGSYITYARRYSIAAITGVAIEDDDGGAAQGHAEKREAVSGKQSAGSSQPSAVSRQPSAGIFSPFTRSEEHREPGCDDDASPRATRSKSKGKVRTGHWLAETAASHGLLDEFIAIGAELGFPAIFNKWTPEQVARAIEFRRERLAQ